MKSLTGFPAVVAVLLSFAPARPALAESPSTDQWIVAAGSGNGAAGESYYSSLHLYNPHPVDAPVAISFLPQSPLDSTGSALGDNSNALPLSFVVPAGGKLDVESFWELFGGAGHAGAIRITPTGTDPQGLPLSVVALSRTTGVKRDPDREFRGPLIAAQGPESLVGAGESARVPLLETGQSNATAYRSNLFLLSTNAGSSTVVELTLVDGWGESRGTKTVTLGRLSQTQVNDLGRFFGYVSCAHGCPSGSPIPELFDILVAVRSGGPVVVGGVVIENENGSSVYTTPVRLPAP